MGPCRRAVTRCGDGGVMLCLTSTTILPCSRSSCHINFSTSFYTWFLNYKNHDKTTILQNAKSCSHFWGKKSLAYGSILIQHYPTEGNHCLMSQLILRALFKWQRREREVLLSQHGSWGIPRVMTIVSELSLVLCGITIFLQVIFPYAW